MGSIAPSCTHQATYQLSIKDVFDGLSQNEKLYAHHLSQAAWYGSRIILRQTSLEGPGIFDFILELHKACQGQWTQFTQRFGIPAEELDDFLDFAGMFLSKLNNFCVKFSPIPGQHAEITHLYYRERVTERLYQRYQRTPYAKWQASHRMS